MLFQLLLIIINRLKRFVWHTKRELYILGSFFLLKNLIAEMPLIPNGGQIGIVYDTGLVGMFSTTTLKPTI